MNKVEFAGKITVEAENRIDQHSQKQQKLNILPNITERFSATEADTDLCGPNLKGEVTHHLVMARKKKIPCCTSHKSPKRTPVKPVGGNLQYPYTFFEKRNSKKLQDWKIKEQPRIAVDSTEHAVRTVDNKILHPKLISKPVEFQRSRKKDLSPNKHKLQRPGGKYLSASERTRLMEEGIISE